MERKQTKKRVLGHVLLDLLKMQNKTQTSTRKQDINLVSLTNHSQMEGLIRNGGVKTKFGGKPTLKHPHWEVTTAKNITSDILQIVTFISQSKLRQKMIDTEVVWARLLSAPANVSCGQKRKRKISEYPA